MRAYYTPTAGGPPSLARESKVRTRCAFCAVSRISDSRGRLSLQGVCVQGAHFAVSQIREHMKCSPTDEVLTRYAFLSCCGGGRSKPLPYQESEHGAHCSHKHIHHIRAFVLHPRCAAPNFAAVRGAAQIGRQKA